MTEWSLLHELITANIDRLGDLIITTINSNSTKPVDPIDPFPRPRTEIDRARERFEASVEDDLGDVIAQAQSTWVDENGQALPATDN